MDERVELIARNLKNVQERIQRAALTSGRDEKRVQLVVVSKKQPTDLIVDAIRAGAAVFGENYPEETVPKILAIRENYTVEWHMIGHLQSRKGKLVSEYFDVLESLDGFDLANRLDRLLDGTAKKLPVYLEFNVSGEGSKFGWPAWDEAHWQDLLPEIEKICELPHLEVRGLMTMPPMMEQAELVRPFFARLRRLSEFFSERLPGKDFSGLSMGTSSDFEVAVEEGASLVRIGTAIFGPRL